MRESIAEARLQIQQMHQTIYELTAELNQETQTHSTLVQECDSGETKLLDASRDEQLSQQRLANLKRALTAQQDFNSKTVDKLKHARIQLDTS